MSKDKTQWTLDLIKKLQETKIVDPIRLDMIKDRIESGKEVFESDKQYLKEKFKELQEIEKKPKEFVAIESKHPEIESNLKLVDELLSAEIGNPDRLKSIKKSLTDVNSLSSEDTDYLKWKKEQFQKVNKTESSFQFTLKLVEKLQTAEIGNSERLDSIKELLEKGGILPSEDTDYLKEKIKQLEAIEKSKKDETEDLVIDKPKSVPIKKEIMVKRARLVDPDARYCAYCERSVHPERDFSVAALVILLFLGIIPGIIYYFLKSPACPICKHSQWAIPPADDLH